jgi:aryl-alcohol dehydrogenase-like predicted oxidoreductase
VQGVVRLPGVEMPYSHIPGINKPVSRLVQGTMMISTERKAQGFALLDEVFELGGNTFDTAHRYGNGASERAVGQWVRERGVRDEVVIIGKGAHHNEDRKRVTPFDITSDLYDSLARFQFDSIDLYLLHRDDPSVPVEPIIEVLNEHQQAGRIGAFGVSNWTHQRIQAANAYAVANGLAPFVASSPQFSLGEQRQSPWPDCISISGSAPASAGARAWYAQEQMALFTWSSLAGGFFSGRFRRDNLDRFTGEMEQVCIQAYASEANFERLERTGWLAAEKGLTVAQVALAYVMSQPLNIFAVVGPQSGARFKENREACLLQLTAEEIAWLDLTGEAGNKFYLTVY